VIIQGESGANDPVGIALLVSLLTIGSGPSARYLAPSSFRWR
jgi:NhaP-type Na+/H+ or K+/H+ antiporter